MVTGQARHPPLYQVTVAHQLSLPWVGNDEYWESADDTQRYSYCANALILPDLSPHASPSEALVDTIKHHALSAKACGNPKDNPTWNEAMSGENAADYYNADIEELITLQEKVPCWELVWYKAIMNVLLKCKHYPDGKIKKLKALYACGN